MVEIPKEVIKAYALENAVRYKGKANPSAVLSALFVEGLQKSEIKDTMPTIQEIIKEVNSLTPAEQSSSYNLLKRKVSKRQIREGLPELPYAHKGKVVMRFAPFPSGPLHIGNARPLILNDEYVKRYGGKLLLVMDDTIGSEAKPIEKDAYKLIEEGAKWLGVNYQPKIVYKSDRIEKYYAYAEEMLKKGYLYVCNCSREDMRNLRIKGKECSCRQFSKDEQMQRWASMFLAEEGEMCVRLKTNMSDPDPAFRDRVMFRISDRRHARIGRKYRVYPLLDFSWAIDDHLLGVTHILRGMELTMETRVERFIWDIFGWQHPEVIYNGHFAIQGIKISKSKGAQEVKTKVYSGWNDPRTWSLQSLKDRGFQPEALREFIINMGIKKTSVTTPIDVLYTLNRKIIGSSPRYFFLEEPTRIRISGCPPIQASIPRHPDGTKGYKTYQTNQEFLIAKPDFEKMGYENYRLMHLLNFQSDNTIKTKPVTFSFISKEPNSQLGSKFIPWLPADTDNTKVTITMPDGSIKKGLGEPELRNLKVGEIVMFEKIGFAKLNKKGPEGLAFLFAHN